MVQQINKEKVKELFIYDNGVIRWKDNRANNKVKAGDIAGCLNSKGYYHLAINGKRYKNHRLIWIMHFGEISNNLQIDHINGIRTDNRIENLRVVSNLENSRNRNFAKGCHFDKDKNKWRASIRRNGKSIHLGYFDNEKEAHEKYLDHKGYLMGYETETARVGGFGSTGK